LLSETQRPEAIIIACADSRVPPEVLFDQGVGDLFVVRVAGNIVSGAGAVVKGSIEYAVAELGVKLIMVLGHSNCGAVKAAVKHINDSARQRLTLGQHNAFCQFYQGLLSHVSARNNSPSRRR